MKRIAIKITSLLFLFSGVFIYSCEPDYCAWCYTHAWPKWDRSIEICADDRAELEILVDNAEAMGYYCDYK